MAFLKVHPRCGLVALILGMLGVIGVVAAKENSPRAPASNLVDRSEYYDANTVTSDDLRRVPVPSPTGSATTMVIRNERLFDGTDVPARSATLIIADNKIASILKPEATDWPQNAEVIDVAGMTVMPGLIDLHTHLTYVNQFGTPPELTGESQAEAALRGAERLRYYLETGVTSVRDVGSHGFAPFILKQWVADGRIAGSRIFAAGQLIVGEGGHGTEGFPWRTAPGYPDSLVREASGADDWRTAVRAQFKRGADLIKLASHFDESEIQAAVQEAHRLGLRVTVDSETIFTEMAVKAGVDCVEHPLPRSDATIALMARQGTYSVPTLVPYQIIIAEAGGYHFSTSRRFTLTEPVMFDIVSKMRRAGIKLGVGTDLVVDWYRRLPEPYLQELKNFQRIGYTPAQSLVAATRTSAEILGMADRLGTLEPGKLADLIVLDGQPDVSTDDLRKLRMVMVGGRIFMREGHLVVPPRIPQANHR